MAVKKGLGRGLESLFAMYDEEVEKTSPEKTQQKSEKNGVDMVELGLIKQIRTSQEKTLMKRL